MEQFTRSLSRIGALVIRAKRAEEIALVVAPAVSLGIRGEATSQASSASSWRVLARSPAAVRAAGARPARAEAAARWAEQPAARPAERRGRHPSGRRRGRPGRARAAAARRRRRQCRAGSGAAGSAGGAAAGAGGRAPSRSSRCRCSSTTRTASWRDPTAISGSARRTSTRSGASRRRARSPSFRSPSTAAQIGAITAGPDGNLWFIQSNPSADRPHHAGGHDHDVRRSPESAGTSRRAATATSGSPSPTTSSDQPHHAHRRHHVLHRSDGRQLLRPG